MIPKKGGSVIRGKIDEILPDIENCLQDTIDSKPVMTEKRDWNNRLVKHVGASNENIPAIARRIKELLSNIDYIKKFIHDGHGVRIALKGKDHRILTFTQAGTWPGQGHHYLTISSKRGEVTLKTGTDKDDAEISPIPTVTAGFNLRDYFPNTNSDELDDLLSLHFKNSGIFPRVIGTYTMSNASSETLHLTDIGIQLCGVSETTIGEEIHGGNEGEFFDLREAPEKPFIQYMLDPVFEEGTYLSTVFDFSNPEVVTLDFAAIDFPLVGNSRMELQPQRVELGRRISLHRTIKGIKSFHSIPGRVLGEQGLSDFFIEHEAAK